MALLEVRFGVVDDQKSRVEWIQANAKFFGGVLIGSARDDREAVDSGLLNGDVPVLFLDGVDDKGAPIGQACLEYLKQQGLLYEATKNASGVIVIGASSDEAMSREVGTNHEGSPLVLDYEARDLGLQKIFENIQAMRAVK